jgi:hypothetical protein
VADEIQKFFDLGQNSRLESLHLTDVAFSFCNAGARAVGSHIPVFLSQITSLQELYIDISHASAIKPGVWTDIDEQLNRPQFSNLRLVKFKLNPARRVEDSELVKDNLPLSAARSIFRFG